MKNISILLALCALLATLAWIERRQHRRRLDRIGIRIHVNGTRGKSSVTRLIAAGGTLYFAFPLLYASSFSGFYLPLMVVLWLLMLRAIGIEFRAHIEIRVWQDFFDVVFSGSSILLAVFFGAALGNVVRGVPLDATGYFFEPLWTNFKLRPQIGILDWYTVLIGVLALVTLTA